MSFNYASTNLVKANTPTSYADVLGLYLGLTRFVGESNSQFLARLYRSAKAVKDTSVKGLINNLTDSLNLNRYKGIAITYVAHTVINCVPGQLTIGSTHIPLFKLDDDTYIEWRMLSDVINDINNISGLSAELLIPDGPALMLPQQSNTQLFLNETVVTSNVTYTFKNTGFIPGSELFNLSTPSYSITEDTITFAGPPPTGLLVSYQSISPTYSLVVSDVNLVPLVAGTFITNSTNSQNVLGYQVRETLQNVMNVDRSYWGL